MSGAVKRSGTSTLGVQRRKRDVSSSYGTTAAMYCERVGKGRKYAHGIVREEMQKRSFAGVLSPISFAVERNGAVGDKNKYLALASAKHPR